MQNWLTRHHSAPKRLLAVALIVLTLGLALASSSEALHRSMHRSLHQHCDESSCVVHLFAQGLVDAAAAAAILPVLLFLTVFGLPVFQSILPNRVEFLLPPGRAPPQACSIH